MMHIEFGSAHANALAREMRAYDTHPELAEVDEEIAGVEAMIRQNQEEIAAVVQHFRDELARATPVAGAKEQPASGAPVMVKLCARCGGDHKVTFTRLTNSIDIEGHRFEWWAMCPVLNEPIIMRMSMVEEDGQ